MTRLEALVDLRDKVSIWDWFVHAALLLAILGATLEKENGDG